MKGIISKTLIATGICAAALVGAGASPALAGEVTGNYSVAPDGTVLKGKLWTPNGASECSFSGQNDGFHDPALADGPEDAATRTQTYGAVAQLHLPFLPKGLPGYACNPAGARP